MHSEVINSKYIYEFDLREFFDRVNLDNLSMTLKKLDIPENIVHHLIGWSRIRPVIQTPRPNDDRTRLKLSYTERIRLERVAKRSKSLSDWKANYMLDTSLRAQKATDLNWISGNDKLSHLHQHMTISFKERNFYKDFRHSDWMNDYCYFNGVALPSSKEVRGPMVFTFITHFSNSNPNSCSND